MRNTKAIFLIFVSIAFTNCGYVVGYDVKQKIEPCFIHSNTMELKTVIWANGEIVASWYDDIKGANNDDLISYRKRQADSFISAEKDKKRSK